MRKLSLWVRAHPAIGDSAIAALLLLFDTTTWHGDRVYGAVPGAAFWSVTALLLGPLLVRRRNPLACAVVVALGGVLQLATHQIPGSLVQLRPADLALCFALYTLGAYVGRKQALGYGAVLLLGTAAWALLSIRIGVDSIAVFCTAAVLLYAVFYLAAEYYGARRAYSAEVERRLALLETERDQQARIAVADERARIARELHDVVAHAVSVIVVQADGASYAVRANPEVAQQAISTISETGRTALAELRRLLGVLRDESDHDAELAPQPDANSLAGLADQVGASGLPVRLRISGDLDGLPESIGRNLYRIIQEALTNTLKHGGPGAGATVAVDAGTERVEVLVEDDGSGEGTLAEVSGGNGLVGMRERAAVHGGTLEAGPVEGGGWRVHVRIPVASE